MRAPVAVIICASVIPLAAQNPAACTGKTVPLKPPVMISCVNATPSCLTDQYGNNGRWIWSCPDATSSPTTPAPTLSLPPFNVGDIPNAMRPAPINNPLDTAIELQRLRQLQLENQQLQLTNQQQQQINANAQTMSAWVLTNDLVIKLVKDGRILESDIINVILTAIPSYSLAANDLAALRSAGVSERIISAMIYRNPPTTHSEQVSGAATVTPQIQFTGGDLSVKLFRQILASGDKQTINLMKTYIMGLGVGMEWVEAQRQATLKSAPLFCPSQTNGLSVNNFVDLIEVGLKTVASAVERGFMKQADVDESPIGSWLVAGFVQAFPCK
jgi:hypothetical protein